MAVFLPALKIALPYITQAVAAAIPAFTSRPVNGKADDVVPEQIAELQAAVTQNAETVQGLAVQMKEIIKDADAGMAAMQQQITMLRRLVILCLGAVAVGIVVIIWLLAQ
ncbi:hypothetical protein [Pusillimonas sp. ANT_WB101]|uniref:hypothetical protein n=1 Tax=Pusillimonas sp. ANT_WB101 TaxID=2597356 RepID=UPI0011EFBA99|nr:hypothetical protein [Pusillimonas sp. ANT_WB101]KAA0889270.1 hypothetical protein FQ179_19020 [Pusillimonas sp. ANT_WB101]